MKISTSASAIAGKATAAAWEGTTSRPSIRKSPICDSQARPSENRSVAALAGPALTLRRDTPAR